MPRDATRLLEDDHETVRTLFDDLEETEDAEERREILAELRQEIEIHAQIEEEIFYPAVRRAMGTRDGKVMVEEALQEHATVDKTLGDLEGIDPASAAFEGKAQVLRELVEHHANEEEERMFEEARNSMDPDELEALGARLDERKTELKQDHSRRRVAH